MQIITTIPDDMPLEAFRFLVKFKIEGDAKGASPLFISPAQLPPLYQSGVVYREEPGHGGGKEFFDLPQTVYARGWGDCDDLCIWRIAELLAQGVRASCSIADITQLGDAHVQVRLPPGFTTRYSVPSPHGGHIEDPSMILGASSDWPTDFLYDRR